MLKKSHYVIRCNGKAAFLVIMDIAVLTIVMVSAIWGRKKGLSQSLANFMHWIICIILALFLNQFVKKLLIDLTPIDKTLTQYFAAKISDLAYQSPVFKVVPYLFNHGESQAETQEALCREIASNLADGVISVIVFLLVLLVIKIILVNLLRLIAKQKTDDFTGFMDKLGGLIFGGAKGLLYTLLVFAILFPILSFLWPEASKTIMGFFDGSAFSRGLYEHNFLLVLLRDFFS